MAVIPGPIIRLEINGLDMTDSIRFTGIDAAPAPPPAATWDTLTDAYAGLMDSSAGESGPDQPRVVDQDGNPVPPPRGWLRDLGRC